MKRKPQKSEFISWLYGDMSKEEAKIMEDYLRDNPEGQNEMEELKNLRKFLGNIPDEDVGEPALIVTEPKSFMSSAIFRTVASVAAAVLLIVVTGFLTGFKMQVEGNRVLMTFGAVQQNTKFLSESEVKEVVQSSLNNSEMNFNRRLANIEEGVDNKFKSYKLSTQNEIDKRMEQKVLVSERQIEAYVNQLDQKRKLEIREYFAVNTVDQQVYMQNILKDFTTYMEQQRREDLIELSEYISEINKETQQNQMRTDELLENIITQVSYVPVE